MVSKSSQARAKIFKGQKIYNDKPIIYHAICIHSFYRDVTVVSEGDNGL